MEKSKVIVVPCPDYEEETVYNAMKTGIEALGGIGCFADQQEKLLVKTNFLSAADKDSAIVTHPSVIKGMLRILQEEGYLDVSYGDSPGHGSSKAAVRKLGLDESSSYGAKMADMNEEVKVSFPEGKTCKEFIFTKEVTEADAIINLCKMKTHALERITGAVKNVYGYVCGRNKATGHTKYPNDMIFARMLCDIHAYKKPRLSIMDGIVAMEGNGPASGNPTPMKVLLFSADPVALDTVFCYLVDLDPTLIPTCTQGEVLGIGTCSEENIEIYVATSGNSDRPVAAGEKTVVRENKERLSEAGKQETVSENDGKTIASDSRTDDYDNKKDITLRKVTRSELLAQYGNPKFDVPRRKARLTFLKGFSDVMTVFARRPAIEKSKCIKCGICVDHCPVPGKAVDFTNGKDKPPVYDYKKCIRCYCCQEMCPQHAIHVRGRA